MAGKPRPYILTETAERDFREARGWSLSRWGRALTKQYFTDLHECAERIARNSGRFAPAEHVPNTAELRVYPIREHYLVYVPIREQRIAIVALIRQTRDVPAILNANGFVIRRQLRKILAKLALVNTAWDNFFCPANQLVMNGAYLSPGRALPSTHSKVSFHKAAFTSHGIRSAQHRRGRALCNAPRRWQMMSMPGKILQIRSICPPTLGVGRVGMLVFLPGDIVVFSVRVRLVGKAPCAANGWRPWQARQRRRRAARERPKGWPVSAPGRRCASWQGHRPLLARRALPGTLTDPTEYGNITWKEH